MDKEKSLWNSPSVHPVSAIVAQDHKSEGRENEQRRRFFLTQIPTPPAIDREGKEEFASRSRLSSAIAVTSPVAALKMMKGNNFSSPVPMTKLEKFTATEFNDWKLNTQFGMKYLNVFYTVQSDRATVMGTEAETQWIADEDFCRDYLLNCLSSSLAKTYIKMKTAKEIWEALEEHFRQEEDLSKAHLVDKFHSFMFDEEKAILPQLLT
ncbi:hypothetical protein KSP39_PZI012977 [Platanthera zijinensis]|uniref:Uncharacterized protein n=1 Tax=Platanthera zijinensis TaxID=2320716 RepID=A0AAP0BDK6_9ASPA